VTIFAAALLLGAAVQAQAPAIAVAPVANAKPARPADWAARVEHGIALARAMQPEDLVIGATMKALGQGLAQSLHGNPEIQQIETKYPGFIDRYAAAAQPPLEKLFRKRMPELWHQMGEAIATEMSVAEIDQATRFYAGPVGQHLLRLGTDNADLQAYVAAGVNAGVNGQADEKAEQEQLAKGMTGAMLVTLGAMSQEEREAFSAFLVSPAGQAMTKAGPSLAAASANWMSEDDPEAADAMANVAQGVMQDLTASDAKTPKPHSVCPILGRQDDRL
jgi:hypothetical protein